MNPDLEAAARSLSVFDPLNALNLVALRSEPEARVLQGIALAQLGEYRSAKRLLEGAVPLLEERDALAHARALAAWGEVELAFRNVTLAGSLFERAIVQLRKCGDGRNAMHVCLQRIRQLLLMGQIAQATKEHAALSACLDGAPAQLVALAELIGVELAKRRLDPIFARAALTRARRAATRAALSPLEDEVERSAHKLEEPLARLIENGRESLAHLEDLARLRTSDAWVLDTCRRQVRFELTTVSLATRPVLLSLCLELARNTPSDVPRETLARVAFATKTFNDSVRARLRVDMGRLRRLLRASARVVATPEGYSLSIAKAKRVVVLLPPTDGEASTLLALLSDGESWPTSALALALGKSQRVIQRTLCELQERDQVLAVGRGRAQRWVANPPGRITTALLLDAGKEIG